MQFMSYFSRIHLTNTPEVHSVTFNLEDFTSKLPKKNQEIKNK